VGKLPIGLLLKQVFLVHRFRRKNARFWQKVISVSAWYETEQHITTQKEITFWARVFP